MSGSAFVGIYGIWQDAAGDAENEQWVRQTARQLEPIKVGHYIGETDLTANADRARLSFAAPNRQRLGQLRNKYDPNGVFFSYLEPNGALRDLTP